MLASRSVVSVLLRGWETFLYDLKAGPASGRLRRPPSGPGQFIGVASVAGRKRLLEQAPDRMGGLGLTALGVLQQLVHATQQVRHPSGGPSKPRYPTTTEPPCR
jgi:hypothetical protein